MLGELSTIAQLTGLDAVKLISLIIRASTTARMHKRNCRQFARHLKLIGNLLSQLNLTHLKRYPDTREPLEQLEDALRRSYVLVDSCQGRSYLYLLAMGWNIVYQFRKAQSEIDRYLRLVPLITLVDNARVRERLEDIERDQNEYTLDEEDQRVQSMILDHNNGYNHPHHYDYDYDDYHRRHQTSVVLKKSLSSSYPKCTFDEALRKENAKLRMELQLSQANMDVHQCEVIQRLLDVTETVCEEEEKSGMMQMVVYEGGKKVEEEGVGMEMEVYSPKKEKRKESGEKSNKRKGSEKKMMVSSSSSSSGEWRTDLLDCCAEPCLCLKTCFYPCGTFSRIATVTENRYISPGEACNELFAYSLILSCCCYTCCIRRKLRLMLNINGGVLDDFLSHIMCCCCALVQEWREVEFHYYTSSDDKTTRTKPPSTQFMES